MNEARQNSQLILDLRSRPEGEAQGAGLEVTQSFTAVSEPESPASTNRLMEEVCERET
jgi:hypothetical protein